MNSPLITDNFSIERAPLFIADPDGIFAAELANLISQELLPVIITRKISVKQAAPSAITIIYRSRVPKIPNNNFIAIYLVQGEDDFPSDFFRTLLKEAKQRDIPFYLISDRRTYSKRAAQQVFAFKQGRVFLYGDIVDHPSLLNPASRIVEDAKERGRIVIADQGLQEIFPVSKQFVVDTIVRYSIVEKIEKQCIAIIPPGDMYELSLARIIQHINSQLLIDFYKQKKIKKYIPDLPEGSIVVSEKDDSLSSALRVELERVRDEGVTKKHGNHPPPPIFRFFYLGFLSVVLFFALIIFMTGGMAFFGERLLIRSVRLLGQMRFSEAKQQAEFAHSALIVSDASMQILAPMAKLFFVKQPIASLEKKLQIGERGSTLLVEMASGASEYQKLFMTGEKIEKEKFIQATQEVKNSLVEISLLAAEGGLPRRYIESLWENKKSIDIFLATADILPDLLGFGKEKKYLVLFQNNNELRPGGGFIGSFAVITVKDGKFGELNIRDVYDVDGRLKGHVEPPPALKKYLGVAHWYLRDSNFSPDFTENGANAAFFLNLETGEKTDGVIAIDTSVLEGILRVFGPIHLQNLQKEVTAENVVELTQEGSEKDFFPGSTQKKDFLNELYQEIRRKVGQKGRSGGISFLRVINAGLVQKHILIAFADPKLSLPFLLQGASSSLKTQAKNSDWTQGFFGVNEANVGANKVNKYIERKFLYDITLDQAGEVKTQVTEVLENKSGKGSRYGGDYKVYLRLLLPANLSPEEITIDGVKQVVLAPLESQASRVARGAVATNTLEVERIDIAGKSTYGFFLTVPVLSKKTIVIKYTQRLDVSNPVGKYALNIFKQPGTGPDLFAFSLSLPKGYDLLSSNLLLKKNGTSYSLLSQLASDQEINFSFGKK